ncbi:uncharacterized protein TM35_000341420 [Trypanosoma theileri]|uniref:Uncharacterized protein n=1 Tax=Trypanosoma theileri TaxID=67003 RepID=A0A1X0NN06_9TRYP|nr:uncharacterized protein TM35_000341420 [Trypanosoma theileri]ORC85530.1 hypothetical protein TM35_000341420 [Trypanosoma theileri]
MKVEASCEKPKADLRDELDASVEFGSGYISLFGPPSSGKTTLLLQYLTAREQHVHRMKRSFHLEYVSAKALDGDPLQRLTWRLQPQARRRRTECSLLQFGCLIRKWLDAAAEGSEMHFVVDDADVLEEDTIDINHWLSACLAVGVQERQCHRNKVCLWVVSQMPLRISNCFRFHFVCKPDAAVVRAWLDHLFNANRALLPADPPADTPHLTLEQTHTAVVDAVGYYTAHLPMRASVVAQDLRQLLQRVCHVLPLLAPHYTAASGRPNAMHHSAAWGKQRQLAAAGEGDDPLVTSLKRIGYSAMLWALSAFYCGAVHKSKHAFVFGDQELQSRTNSSGANVSSHKAAVLSSSAHVVYVPRLMRVYQALLKICVHHVDPLEFGPTAMAVQHHQTLVSWGLLVHSSASSKAYHCHIPVTSALGLSKLLSLNLYDLIPS